MGSVLSGAGPSILVISKKEALEEVKSTVLKTWADIDVGSKVLTLPLEKEGAKVL